MVIFALSIIPFLIAWFMAKNPEIVKLGTNNGQLISPPVTTEFTDFAGYDAFSAEHLDELKGHWVLINVVGKDGCQAPCQDALYKTHQIGLMMGKEIARIRRLALLTDTKGLQLPKQWIDDARLLKSTPSEALRSALHKLGAGAETGGLLLMDPLGNLMMQYPAGYDPYKVRNDLSKLLRISQIG